MVRWLLFFFIILEMGILSSCDDSRPDLTPLKDQKETTLVSRYRASVFSKAGSTGKGDYVALLEKAEKVTLLGEEEMEVKGKNRMIARVRLTDGKEGYLDRRHLASSALVVLRDDLRLYRRPVVTSGRAKGEEFLTTGVVAFLENEEFQDVNWMEISGGSWNEGTYFRGWIREGDGVSENTDWVAGAVRFETIRNDLEKKGELNRGDYDELNDLAGVDESPVAPLASGLLQKIECDKSGSCKKKGGELF